MTDDSAGDQLRGLSEDISALVRHEVQRGQAEMAAKARQAAKGSALIAAAGVLAAGAAGTSTALLIRTLDRVMPPRAAAAAATAGLAGAAAALAFFGLAALRPVRPLLPQQTIRAARQDVEAADAGEAPAGAG